MARRPALFRGLALTIGLALALGLAELGLRAAPDAALGFTIRDGAFHQAAEFEPDPTRNVANFHDADPDPDATKRLILLGDSYVASVSTSVPEIPGQQLEARLGGWDVVSMGRRGWGLAQEHEALAQHGPTLAPDRVITLWLGFNDVANDAPALRAMQEAQYAALSRYRPDWFRLPLDEAPGLLAPWSRLNQLASHRLARARAEHGAGEMGIRDVPVDFFVYIDRPSAAWDAAWQIAARHVEATRDLARSLGADYALVSASTPHGIRGAAGAEQLEAAYPPLAGLPLDLDHPDREMAAICASLGVPFLALEPEMRRLQAERSAPLHWPIDGHWTPEGNAVAAELIAEWLDAL